MCAALISHPSFTQDGELLSIAADVANVGRIDAVPIILRILCDTTGLGFAAIARVTDTSWTACAVLDRIGFGVAAGDQLDVATTLCHEVHGSRTAIVIENASEDPGYLDHPTPTLYGFKSYVSVPIVRRDGRFFGTICAIDPRPAALSKDQMLPTLNLFAELVAAQLDVEERLEANQAALVEANEAAVLREQFVAVLGHDLRNPIGAIANGLEWLSRRPLDERAGTLVGHLKRSCARMSELVENVLDFARGRLGAGIAVERRETAELAGTLLQVVDELRAVHLQRTVRTEFDLGAPVFCDPHRIGQLLSNLVANALTHGAPDTPVQVAARSDEGHFLLSVSNEGRPIAPGRLAQLFQPFRRAGSGVTPGGPLSEGLGLGLYIASEIARSHGGTLGVSSTERATTFTLEIPVLAGDAVPPDVRSRLLTHTK